MLFRWEVILLALLNCGVDHVGMVDGRSFLRLGVQVDPGEVLGL
jgi:hypothetical protein